MFPDVWSEEEEEEEEEEESSDVKAVVPITIQVSGIPRAFELPCQKNMDAWTLNYKNANVLSYSIMIINLNDVVQKKIFCRQLVNRLYMAALVRELFKSAISSYNVTTKYSVSADTSSSSLKFKLSGREKSWYRITKSLR